MARSSVTRCVVVGLLTVLGAAALASQPLAAQPFYKGYRSNLVDGNYFGSHRTFSKHVSGHVGLLDYVPYRVPTGPTLFYRARGYRASGRHRVLESPCSPYTYGITHHALPFYAHGRYGYTTRRHGNRRYYPQAFVATGTRAWRGPATYRSTVGPTPWRQQMAAIHDGRGSQKVPARDPSNAKGEAGGAQAPRQATPPQEGRAKPKRGYLYYPDTGEIVVGSE